MASFSLFGASATARNLFTGEFAFIGQNGSLATTADAIDASGSVDIAVMGTLFSSTGRAIDHDGTILDLQIGQLASIGTGTGDTVDSRFTGSVYVSNDGYLYSGDDALDLRSSDGGGSINIINSGTITGRSDGIVTGSGDSGTRIVNHGDILGADGGIDHLSGDATVLNHGYISGSTYGYDGSNDIDIFRNFGSISGGVSTSGGSDRVRNAGTIDLVLLGDGDDEYSGYGGEDVIGHGGAGNDVMRGGSGSDNFKGNDGDDTLRGRDGDDPLRGQAGEDTIFGNRGNDLLIGGGQADTFVFNSGDGFDRLLDFKGSDQIDLKNLGLENFSEVASNIRDVKRGSVIDLVDDYELSIFVRKVDASDLGFGDFII